jgi:hypothetical protein
MGYKHPWRVHHYHNSRELSSSKQLTLTKAILLAQQLCATSGSKAVICKRPSLEPHTVYWRDSEGLQYIRYKGR